MIDRRREGTDATGKWLGVLVFIVGIVLLLVTFYLAWGEIGAARALQVAPPPSGPTPPPTPAPPVGRELIGVVARWVLLFLMAYVGSAVAARGIGLYSASRALYTEEV